MLFFCRWEGSSAHASLLVDATDEANAAEIATEEGEGIAPDTTTLVPPGVFAVEVYFDDEDQDAAVDDAVLIVEPLEHTLDALAALENGEPVTIVCGEQAEGDAGETVTCALEPQHAPPHRAGDLEW